MRLFVLIGGLIVVVLMTALLAPLFVNWSDYKGRFEEEVSRLLGQPVRVAGEASARILPFPSVSFTDIEVGPPEAPLVTATRFSLDAELAPFLSGEVLIFDLRIDEPHITLTIDENGIPIWPLPDLGPISPAQITLENAAIRDGRLTVLDPEQDRAWTVSNLAMRVSANSFFGPWRAEGSARFEQLNADFNIATGQWARDGFALRVAANLPDHLVRLVSDGRIAPDAETGELTYAGGLTALPYETDQIYRIEGDFSSTVRGIEVPDYRAAFGDPNDPYVVNGSASIVGGDEPGFALSASGTQVNVPTARPEGGADPDGGLGERLAAINAMLAGLPWPAVPGTVNLDLPAVVVGDTTIRGVRVLARPAPDDGAKRRWRIDRLDAEFPGRTAVEADGLLTLPQPGEGVEQALFEGNLVVASRQPSGLARWLSGNVDEAIRGLPAAGFSARVTLGAERQVAEDVEIIAGDVQLNARVARGARSGATPHLSVVLSGSDVDLATLQALAAVFGVDQGGLVMAGHDVDLALDLTRADIDGVPVEQLETAIRARGARTEVDRLVASGVFGAAVTGTASIDRLDGNDVAVTFDTSIIGAEGAPFVRAMSDRFADVELIDHAALVARMDPAAFADLQLTVVGSARTANGGQTLEASASASGLSGGAQLFVQTSISDDQATAIVDRLTVDGSFSHDDALRLLPFAAVPLVVTDGPDVGLSAPGEATVSFRRARDGEDQVSMALTAGADRVSLDGVLIDEAAGRTFDGFADLDLADAEPWLFALGHVLPGTGLGTPVAGTAEARFGARLLRLAGINARVADSAIQGDLELTDDAVLGRSLRGELAIDALDGTLIGNLLAGHIDVLTASTRFAAPLYADMAVNLRLVADRLFMGPMTFEAASGVLALDGGLLSVQQFAADHANGARIAGSGRVQNTGGAVSLGAQLDVQDMPAEALVVEPVPVSGRIDLALSLTGSGRTLEALGGSLTGTGVAGMRDIAVSGLDPDAFGTIVRQADAIGFGITPAQIIGLADSALFAAEAMLDDVEAPVTVANGVLRAGNLALQTPDGAMGLAGEVTVDLFARRAGGSLTVTLDPGQDAVAGMTPEIMVAMVTDADGQPALTKDFEPMVAFVTQRALEIEQARIERLQSRILERQRLRREARYARYLRAEDNARREEERLRALARVRLEEIEVERQRQAEEEARRQAEEQARLAAEAEAQRLAEEEAQRQVEEEARRRAEEQARLEAEAEAQRLAEEEAQRQAEEEARRQVEEQARLEAEAEAQRLAEQEEAERRAAEQQTLDAGGVLRAPLPPPGADNAEDNAIRASETPAEEVSDASPDVPPEVDFSEDAVRNLIEGLSQ